MTKTILITGGAGFVASNLIRAFLSRKSYQQNTKFLLADALSGGHYDSIKELVDQYPNIEFLRIDLTEEKALAKIFRLHTIHTIIHLAAQTGSESSLHHPHSFFLNNVMGTYQLLQMALTCAQVSDDFKFIKLTPDIVYGPLSDKKTRPGPTDGLLPNNPYAASQAAADHMIQSYAHCFGLPAICVRASSSYGPFQSPHRFIPLALLKHQTHSPIHLFGRGEQIRQWIFIDDLCDGLIKILEEGKCGETYHLAGPEEVSNRELIDMITEHSKQTPVIDAGPHPAHQGQFGLQETDTLNFRPLIHLDAGLAKTRLWYGDNADWVGHFLSQ